MNWLQPKLNLRVAQKQILTPGLVQMVSVLALNRLELREMINQEIMANPVLEELGEDGVVTENYADETFLKEETEKVPEKVEANPFDEFDLSSFYTQYLDSGGDPRTTSARTSNGRRLTSFSPRHKASPIICPGSSASAFRARRCARSPTISSEISMKRDI